MARPSPSPPPHPDSGGRGIAKGAFFFAFLAFLMSGFTLLSTWKEGKLLRNLNESTKVIQENFEKFKKDRGGSEKGAREAREGINWDKFRERMKRVEEMARKGDDQARYYFENLKEDFAKWQNSPEAKKASTWFDDVKHGLQETGDKIKTSLPGAAERLKELGEDLQKKVRFPEKSAKDRDENESTETVGAADGETTETGGQ